MLGTILFVELVKYVMSYITALFNTRNIFYWATMVVHAHEALIRANKFVKPFPF